MPHPLKHMLENNPGLEKVPTGLEDGPETAYITSDGEKLYVVLKGHIACFTGPRWNLINERVMKNTLEFGIEFWEEFKLEAERVRNGGTISILCRECRIPLQKHPFSGQYTCFVHGKQRKWQKAFFENGGE